MSKTASIKILPPNEGDNTLLGRVLLGLFRKRNARNRRYLCSFGSYSILFILLPIAINEQNEKNTVYLEWRE